MTHEEARKFGLNLLRGIMERNESYPVYANNVKQAIEALSNGSSEKPINLDLEKELMELCDGTMSLTSMDIARHFYELGRSEKPNNHLETDDTDKEWERMQQEYLEGNHLEGLDEAADDSWALYEYRESPRGLYSTCYVDGFKAGAEWAMEQGESFVASVDYCDGFYIDTTDQEQEVIEKLGLKVMNKVIVQIRKKDE